MLPRRVLIIVTRRIGDVLLATPLIRSFRNAWPHAQIDALVFRGTESVLAGNPDLDNVITVPERPRLAEHARFHAALLRRYDLSVSTLTGDRPTIYAWMFGRFSAGLQGTGRKDRWKRRMLDLSVPFDDLDTHAVRTNLALANALGVNSVPEVVVRWMKFDEQRIQELTRGLGAKPYVVLHASAKFNYKMWHLEGWTRVAQWLSSRGFAIFLSGSNDPEELEYVAALADRLGASAQNLCGKLSLGELACLLSCAALYIGPDTSVTHMSAALGVPSIALFGPSNPVRWGPWPKGYDASRDPWRRIGTQREGNVTLIQGTASCVPCMLEGCERHIASYSNCLQHLSAGTVIAETERLLMRRARA